MALPVLTASFSKIEAFRALMNASEDEHWLTEEKLIESLRGVYTPNDKAMYGSAFHELIEHGEGLKQGNVYVSSTGIVFDQTQAKHALEYRSNHPLMQSEIPLYKMYKTRHFWLLVTMRVDGLVGNIIRDIKTKFSTVDMREWIDSYQWRIYLDALNLDEFYYDVFQVGGFDTLNDAYKAQIKPLEPMLLVRYPTMEEDISSLLNEFSSYIVDKNLTQLLLPKAGSHAYNELQQEKYQTLILNK